MEWDKPATLLLEKVPPFVQKAVREKVETLARERGKNMVTEAEVVAARESFMGKPNPQRAIAKKPIDNEKLSILRKYSKYFDNEGNPVLYQVKSCRGAEVNCPFLITDSGILSNKLRNRLEELRFTEKLIEKVEGQILPHHSMKLAVSGCPNSCSMPQIKDFGVHAVEPVSVDPDCKCIECMKCVETCREDAITVKNGTVTIDKEKCVHCGLCARVCPTGTIKAEQKKYRVMIGGKVGRHPRFALDLLPQADESTTLKALDVCVDIILTSKTEHRFRTLIEQQGIEEIKKRI
ncbi:MAG TPA: 4Fe-4S binding protein [Candidatus Wunengus sp. YC60]|uniref:4Fe-4S binding protein n=1 Tax=Candidatus Wunengus sp. YC60 TaxID=3367697 RepID=UPI004028CF25